MFGYLTAELSRLTQEELDRYKALYCGLCRSLGERHGQLSRLTLNYDMTFLVLLEGSLYEPEELTGNGICLPHPVHARAWARSEASDYAADMNLLLAYLKKRDDWDDDCDPVSKLESDLMRRDYLRIRQLYPRQAGIIEAALKELADIEKSGELDADRASASFGRLMGEIFVMREDRWSGILRQLGMALGEFIYVLDACIDLDGDIKHARYNPFAALPEETDREKYFEDILKMLLGEAVFALDKLPLVQDEGLIKNILCSGLWSEFNKKFGKGKESADVSGSV